MTKCAKNIQVSSSFTGLLVASYLAMWILTSQLLGILPW